MTDRRLALQTILETLLGSRNVYFQPTNNIKMQYPAILYRRNYRDTKFANNTPYVGKKRYSITVIDSNPDSVIPDKIAELPLTEFDRHFTTANLNHDIFNIYF